jgi:hypothetical protein
VRACLCACVRLQTLKKKMSWQFPAISKILRKVQKQGKVHIESAGVSTGEKKK